MRPKRPPKKKGPCPLNGEHKPKGVANQKGDVIEHECACGFSWLRVVSKPKPKPKKGKAAAS